MERYYFHMRCGGLLTHTGEENHRAVYTCAKCESAGPILTPDLLCEDEDLENIPTVLEFEGREIVVCEMLLTAYEWTRVVTQELPEVMAQRGYSEDNLEKRISKRAALKL